jgi:hypothetical protein
LRAHLHFAPVRCAGCQVWYGNLQCPSGQRVQLDADSTRGYGPETMTFNQVASGRPAPLKGPRRPFPASHRPTAGQAGRLGPQGGIPRFPAGTGRRAGWPRTAPALRWQRRRPGVGDRQHGNGGSCSPCTLQGEAAEADMYAWSGSTAMERSPLPFARRARDYSTSRRIPYTCRWPVGLAGASRSVWPGAAAQRLDGIGGRGCSLSGRCRRNGHSARRRSPLWRTRAAHVGAHVGAGTSYACALHAGRRRSAQYAGTQRCEGTRVLREYCELPGTAGVRCPGVGVSAAVGRTLRARNATLQSARVCAAHVRAAGLSYAFETADAVGRRACERVGEGVRVNDRSARGSPAA